MLTALGVARYIIDREASVGRVVTNLRLQKLLYFVQAQFFATKKAPCYDSAMEAWDCGPVFPEVYKHYHIYNKAVIPASGKRPNLPNASMENISLIDRILDQCGRYSTYALITLSQRQTPWVETYVPGKKACIATDLMESFFCD